MPIPLGDVWGNVIVFFQVAIIFLLLLGLPIEKGVAAKMRNLKIHGYCTVMAVVLHTPLTFLVMVPAYYSELANMSSTSLFAASLVWCYVLVGFAVEVLSFWVVWVWLSRPLSDMACRRMKKVMLPLFIVWEISAFIGVLIQIRGIM